MEYSNQTCLAAKIVQILLFNEDLKSCKFWVSPDWLNFHTDYNASIYGQKDGEMKIHNSNFNE